MIRVAVTGAKGRMGSTVVAAVTGAPDMEVVAQLDAGDPITKKTVNGAQVAVDFSVPGVTEANVHALLDAGVDVVGGHDGVDRGVLRARAHSCAGGGARRPDCPELRDGRGAGHEVCCHGRPPISSPPRSSRCTTRARWTPPSGTAVATARGIARARAEAGLGDMPDATEMDELGSRGGRVDGVPVHAVRCAA